MNRRMGYIGLIILGIMSMNLGACMTVKLVSVDKKTQLENQILGTFEQLDQDLVLLSGVRGQGMDKKTVPPGQREAILAQLNRQFRKDDIDNFKRGGHAGEDDDGSLAVQQTELMQADVDFREQVTRLVKEENKDRKVIIKRVIDANKDLSKNDLPVVQKMFFALMVQNSEPGMLVKNPDSGQFEPKPQEEE